MKKNNKKIDIIIPYYYTKQNFNFFKQCLYSVFMQSIFNLLKITIILDNPKKENQELNDFLINTQTTIGTDSFVYIQNEKNLGVGASRQKGLELTSLPFVMFIDGDDTLSSSYSVSILYDIIKEKQNSKLGLISGDFEEENIEEKMFIPHSNDLSWIFAKLYRRKFIEKYNAEFPTSSANEDIAFNTILRLVAKENEIGFVNKNIYNWRNNKESITRKKSNNYLFTTSFDGFIQNNIFSYKIIVEKNKKYIDKAKLNNHILNLMIFAYYYYNALIVTDLTEKRSKEIYDFLQLFGKEIVYNFIDNFQEIDYIDLDNIWKITLQTTSMIFESLIPHISFEDFLKLLG